MSLARSIYSFLLYLLLPFVLLRLLLKSRKNKHYRLRIRERLGWLPFKTTEKRIIWVHAVSVGETIAAKPLIELLLKTYPHYSVLVTTTTPTGSETVTTLFADKVLHYYFPYDLPHIVGRFIKKLKPSLLIIIETEIWPNLYASCARYNIPLLMVNARLSTRSTQQYLRIKALVKETLTNATFIAVRSKEDKQHFLSLGAPSENIELVGNIKFDIAVDDNKFAQGHLLKEQWGYSRKVWVAASTHQGEDKIILAIFKKLKQQLPDLLLIIVPRHPERFDDVYKLLTDSNYSIQRRSDNVDFHNKTDIILGDSMGELLLWYATADVTFIGGSLVKTGGHNPLEATALGIPVVSGSNIFNFNDIYPILCDEHLAWVEITQNDIEKKIAGLLKITNNDFKGRCDVFMAQHRGVVGKLFQHVEKYL
ncbi:MAG TPA: 3-deoxy-D-manno-octulosonic acid transferase [Leucothrix mucor]|nr:3-deoxy-D-manno-octulosonic acid transferase [Leucothrix mucor]